MNEKIFKPFEYDELLSMCMLAVAISTLITVNEEYKTSAEGREMIEKAVRETVDLRWNDSEKQETRLRVYE